ncbi:MAG: queuosine precursor transporter [archaeon]
MKPKMLDALKLEPAEKLTVLIGLFIASLVAANLLGNKISVLAGISVSVGIFAYPITFLIANIFGEVDGPRIPRMLVVSGIVSIIAVLVLTSVSIALPPAARFTYNDAYVQVFSSTRRIMVGSLVAFAFAQMLNIRLFDALKGRLSGKHAWLRYNAAVTTSQFFDTAVFYFIAFYKLTPTFTGPFVISLIFPYWFMKCAFSLLSTPVFYGGVKWFKKGAKPGLPPMAIPVSAPQPAAHRKKR